MYIAFEIHRAIPTLEQRPGWDQSMQLLAELLEQALGISAVAPGLESELEIMAG